MSNPLSGIKIEHWWHAFTILGGAGMVGAFAFHADGVLQREAFFAFFGLFLFGIGQWINHPVQNRLLPGMILTGYNRKPSFTGVCFELFGGIIFIVEAFRILLAK